MTQALTNQIISTSFIVVISTIIWIVLKRIIKRLFNYKSKKIDEKKQKTIESLIFNFVKAFIFLIAALMIMEVYGIDTKSLVASLGVAGLVIGLALQDLLKDFISGMTIIFENQYYIGDIVTINGFKGEVISLTIKTTKLKSYDGQVKILSNRVVTEVVNHTVENSLAIVDIGVSYNTNNDKAEKILKEACEELTKTLKKIKGSVELLGIQSLSDSAVIYRIVVETKPMEHYEIERIIRKKIKETLDKNNIEIPFNQVVIHNAK
ncbi:MAG: mechanosensitive ion channel family protein [Bacilli bacterium]|nr:mechanosensitive ion channel family protein [Bacilli bacterium]